MSSTTGLSRRQALAGGASLILGVATSRPTAAAPTQIVSTIFGGKFEKEYRKAIVEPFEKKFGHQVTLKYGSSPQWLTTGILTKENPEIDVLWLSFPESIRAVNEELGIPLTSAEIPNLKDVDPRWYDFYKRKAVGLDYASFGIAFRTDSGLPAPKSWADLWKPEYKGRLTLPDISAAGGFETLVIAAKLNGGSEQNIGPGFEALKRLRPNVRRFYRSLPEAAQLFERGEVVIGPYWDGRAWGLKDGGSPMSWVAPIEGASVGMVSYHIAKKSKNLEVCKQFVNFALSVEAQEGFCNAMQYGPVNTKAKLTGAAFERVPPLDRLTLLDWFAVEPNLAAWTERFNREIVG